MHGTGTLAGMHDACVMPRIFLPEAQRPCLFMQLRKEQRAQLKKKDRKYLAPVVVRLTPIDSEAQSLASHSICQNTQNKCFVTEFSVAP